MVKPFRLLREEMSKERRGRNAEKTRQIVAEMALSELRKSLELSQAELAEILEVQQASLSKLERRNDMLLSSLRKIIEGMGAELEILAHFPEGTVRIDQF